MNRNRRSRRPSGPLQRLAALTGVRRTRRWHAGALIGFVIAALGVVHVRVQITDQGYERAEAVHREEALLEQRQILKARVEALRDRKRLTAFAEKLELARPQREIRLPLLRVAEQRP